MTDYHAIRTMGQLRDVVSLCASLPADAESIGRANDILMSVLLAWDDSLPVAQSEVREALDAAQLAIAGHVSTSEAAERIVTAAVLAISEIANA